MTNNQGGSRSRTILGNTLTFLPALAVMLSETMKFLHVPAMVQQMAAAGFSEGKLLLVATLRSVSALLFLYPRTRSIGILLLSSFLGAQSASHGQRGEYRKAVAPATLLALEWIGTYLRHPQMLWSFGEGDRGSTTYRASRPRTLVSGKIS